MIKTTAGIGESECSGIAELGGWSPTNRAADQVLAHPIGLEPSCLPFQQAEGALSLMLACPRTLRTPRHAVQFAIEQVCA